MKMELQGTVHQVSGWGALFRYALHDSKSHGVILQLVEYKDTEILDKLKEWEKEQTPLIMNYEIREAE